MKYKLICIDMDGTLLNSKKVVSDCTKKAIKRAHDIGVHVVITTGRVYNNAEFYSNLIGVNSAVIASNGAIVKEKTADNCIFKRTLGYDNIIKALKICRENKIKMNLNTEDSIICTSKFVYVITKYLFLKSMINAEEGKMSIRYISEDKIEKYIQENQNKIIKCEIINLNEAKLERAKKSFKALKTLEIVSSSRKNIEITASSVCKGKAVEALAKHYNIDRKDIMAIGDSQNDLSMIEYSGLGVAMGNGNNEIKSKADYVTDTNDGDGVAKAIEKFILN